MDSINENETLWNEVEFDTTSSLNNDECWNHTNNCIDWNPKPTCGFCFNNLFKSFL